MKWEYKTTEILLTSERVNAELNILGGQGWELVAVLPYSDTDGYSNKGITFFKRAKGKKG